MWRFILRVENKSDKNVRSSLPQKCLTPKETMDFLIVRSFLNIQLFILQENTVYIFYIQENVYI